MGKFVVYLHFGEGEKEPFYVGASSNLERPYNFTTRSKEWFLCYEKYNQKITVTLIQAESKEEAHRLEDELIEKYKYFLCNKNDSTLLPVRLTLLPSAANLICILGDNIRLARLRRNLTAEQICERAGISRPTLWKVEKGDPGVSIACYMSVLFVMGLHEDIVKVALNDPVGRKVQDVNLLASKSRSGY